MQVCGVKTGRIGTSEQKHLIVEEAIHQSDQRV